VTSGNDDAELGRRCGERWLVQRATTDRQAAAFVEAVGYALLFPADAIAAPSLWEAVADEDAVPFATGMGEAESRLWAWKDELPRQGLAWYGKFLYKRGSLLSPRLLTVLYPGAGEPDDHRSMDLSAEAHRIADALMTGPLTTSALREVVGDRKRYDRGIAEVQRQLLVTSAGVQEQRAGWPAGILDLTCRRFDVGGRLDHRRAAEIFFDTMIETSAKELGRAFGWPVAWARAASAHLARV
jgi:hypothetical protein